MVRRKIGLSRGNVGMVTRKSWNDREEMLRRNVGMVVEKIV